MLIKIHVLSVTLFSTVPCCDTTILLFERNGYAVIGSRFVSGSRSVGVAQWYMN